MYYNDNNSFSGKAPLLTKFNRSRNEIKGLILQLDQYFIIYGIRNEKQNILFVGLCMDRNVLHYWKENKNKYETN